MAYDNMRVAVKKFLGQEREHTDALRRMELHYCFTPHFCNPRSGWEKGKVERSVEHIRRRAFAYDVRFGSLEQAQCHLDKVCDRLNGEASNMSAQEKKERVQADIAALRPLDHGDMGCFEQRHARVGKYSTITVDGVHYSVPDRLVGREVPIKMYSERIVVLDGRDKVATHVRSRRLGDWCIDRCTIWARSFASLRRWDDPRPCDRYTRTWRHCFANILRILPDRLSNCSCLPVTTSALMPTYWLRQTVCPPGDSNACLPNN